MGKPDLIRFGSEAAAEADKRERIISQKELEHRIENVPAPRPVAEKIIGPPISLIAEHKPTTPYGEFFTKDTLAERLRAYEEGGADAVSVLTKEQGFGGYVGDLTRARYATELPILRKDFIIVPYQLYESRAYGADAVLLITELLDLKTLANFRETANGLGMECLVEVKNEAELRDAILVEPEMIGINNRDFRTGDLNFEHTFELAAQVPEGTAVIAESGITGRRQMEWFEQIKVDGALVGSHLMRAPDPEGACRDLLGRSVDQTPR